MSVFPEPTNKDYLVIGYGYQQGKRVCVGVPRKHIWQHTHIIGAQGSGKTSLMTVYAYESIRKGFTTVVVDPHGGLVKEVYERTPPEVDTYIVGLGYNGIQLFPFVNLDLIREAQNNPSMEPEKDQRKIAISTIAAGFMAHYSSKEGSSIGGWGVNVDLIAKAAFQTLSLKVEGGELKELTDIVLNEDYRKEILDKARKYPELVDEVSELEDFWDRIYQVILQRQDSATTIMGFINKIMPLYAVQSRARVISGKVTLYDFFKSPKPKLLLMHLPEGDEWVRLVGSLLFASILMASYSRTPEWEQKGLPPVHVIIDEVSAFVTALDILKDALTKVRKFGVGLTIAHQTFAQLGANAEEFGRTLATQSKQSFILSVGSQDAKYLEGRLDKDELKYVGPQPPGHFLFVNREKRKFRGISYYFEEVLQRYRTMPAPRFTKEKVPLENLGARMFVEGIVRAHDYDPSGWIRMQIPLKQMPYIVIPDEERRDKLVKLGVIFGEPYMPVLLALAAPYYGERGIDFLSNWRVGVITGENVEEEIPVLFVTKNTGGNKQYVFLHGVVLTDNVDIDTIGRQVRALINLHQTFAEKGVKKGFTLEEYSFQGMNLVKIGEYKIKSLDHINRVYIYLSHGYHNRTENEIRKLTTDFLSKYVVIPPEATYVELKPFTFDLETVSVQ